MNSRERVKRALCFEEPDRVPVDLGGLKASGIAIEAYARMARLLGLTDVPKVLDTRFMIAWVEQRLLERLHVDVVPLDISTVLGQSAPVSEWVPRQLFSGTRALFPPGTRIREEADGSWLLLDAQGAPTAYRMPRNGYYFDDTSFDQAGTIDPRQFRPVTDIPDETLSGIAAYARRLHTETDHALLGWGGGVCFLGLSLITDRRSNVTLGQPSEWMTMLMTEKDTCHAMMDQSVEASIRCLSQLHEAIGDRCFAWGIAADDSGTQRGEFIRPELWAEMIKPHYTKLCRWIHAHTSWKTFFHCCGSIYHLIPHFIDAGIDILNPVQTSAANMDPVRLKQEFGRRIVFWGGGCDTQTVLGSASPAEVREHVRERLAIFKPGGGYVFNQVHNIQANVPAENILAMFDAAHEFGGY
ncbi:MAG: uroporphyrinogen decarboxylase family protein [Lentisphaerae bacterium]|nr:uroporphyrinogen decarboxylase family protein [Lentisphaerota bacterium]